jgi:folate-binding protein YgfZ
VEGEDAAVFLQGQTTCDVKGLSPGRYTWGAACTHQGRVMADFRLLRGETGFYLILAADMAEPMRKHLRNFVLRSKVTLTDLTPEWGLIGLLRPVENLALPEEPGSFTEQAGLIALRLSDGRGLVAAENAAARRVWAELTESAGPPASASTWKLRDIEAGFPEVAAATTEAFIPQMLNLDALGGVSFNKGCYTGQEIVTRTHYLGQVKRRMLRVRGQGNILPAPGSAIYAAVQGQAKEAGQVVAAAPESDSSFQALAVLGLDYASGGDLRFLEPAGPTVEILDLPYSLETV